MSNWAHVTAPHSRRLLEGDGSASMIELFQVAGEMGRALAADELDDMVMERAIVARRAAVEDLEGIIFDDPDCYNDNGEFIGNPGIDKLAAVSAVRRFWSDGTVS